MRYICYLLFALYVCCTEQRRDKKEDTKTYHGPKTSQFLRDEYRKKNHASKYDTSVHDRTEEIQLDPDYALCYDYCWDCYCAEWDDYYCRDCSSCASIEWQCDRRPIPVPTRPPYYPPYGDDDDDDHDDNYNDDRYYASNYRNYQPIEVNVDHSCACNYAPINITEICSPSLVSEQTQAQGQNQSQDQNSTNTNGLNNRNRANITLDQTSNTTQNDSNLNDIDSDSDATSNAASSATSSIPITLDLGALLLENLLQDNVLPFVECNLDCEYYMLQCISNGFADCSKMCSDAVDARIPQDVNQCAQCFQNQTQMCFEFEQACNIGCPPKFLSLFKPTSQRIYNQKAASVLKTLKQRIDTYSTGRMA